MPSCAASRPQPRGPASDTRKVTGRLHVAAQGCWRSPAVRAGDGLVACAADNPVFQGRGSASAASRYRGAVAHGDCGSRFAPSSFPAPSQHLLPQLLSFPAPFFSPRQNSSVRVPGPCVTPPINEKIQNFSREDRMKPGDRLLPKLSAAGSWQKQWQEILPENSWRASLIPGCFSLLKNFRHPLESSSGKRILYVNLLKILLLSSRS